MRNKAIFDLIKSKQKKGWTFVFLGANQDAWLAGRDLGVSKGNVMQFDTANIKGVIKDIAESNVAFCLDAREQVSTDDYFATYGKKDAAKNGRNTAKK